jgi:hypothetical protein
MLGLGLQLLRVLLRLLIRIARKAGCRLRRVRSRIGLLLCGSLRRSLAGLVRGIHGRVPGEVLERSALPETWCRPCFDVGRFYVSFAEAHLDCGLFTGSPARIQDGLFDRFDREAFVGDSIFDDSIPAIFRSFAVQGEGASGDPGCGVINAPFVGSAGVWMQFNNEIEFFELSFNVGIFDPYRDACCLLFERWISGTERVVGQIICWCVCHTSTLRWPYDNPVASWSDAINDPLANNRVSRHIGRALHAPKSCRE